MKKLLLLLSLVLTTLVWGQEKYVIDNLVDEKAQGLCLVMMLWEDSLRESFLS